MKLKKKRKEYRRSKALLVGLNEDLADNGLKKSLKNIIEIIDNFLTKRLRICNSKRSKPTKSKMILADRSVTGCEVEPIKECCVTSVSSDRRRN